MSDRLTKHDLERNELGEIVAHGIEYAEHHTRQLVMGFAGLLLAGVVGLGLYLWAGHRTSQLNEELARAMRIYTAEIVTEGAKPDDADKPTFSTESARRDRAKSLFSAIAGRTLAPKAAHVAELYLGEIAMAEGDKAAARRHWGTFAKAEGETAMGATAQLNLMRLDREEGHGEDLVTRLRGMLEHSEERPLPEDVVLYQLGLTLQQLGKDGEAKSTFRRLVEEFPRSPLRSEAQRLGGAATPSIG